MSPATCSDVYMDRDLVRGSVDVRLTWQRLSQVSPTDTGHSRGDQKKKNVNKYVEKTVRVHSGVYFHISFLCDLATVSLPSCFLCTPTGMQIFREGIGLSVER